MEYKVPNMEEVRRLSAQKLFKVVSLFAGGGGSSTGYRMAGGDILAINEFVDEARKAYNKNYPGTHIFDTDIRELTGEAILAQTGLKVGELDILDGSPPCASFSMAGNREKDWGKVKKYSDNVQRTDDLFFEYARLVKELQPRVFIAENVKGITLGAAANLLGSEQIQLFGGHKETIYHTLSDCGYRVRYKVLNAKNFRVPQSRERTIFIGVRNDLEKTATFPVGSKPYMKLSEAFATVENTLDDISEVNIEKYAIGKEAKKLKPGGQSKKYFSLAKQSPDRYADCLTQTAAVLGAASIIHWDDRKFTVKEAIRIMSFPDDYYLGEKYATKVERLGRAVPPLMMKAVAEHVYETILKLSK